MYLLKLREESVDIRSNQVVNWTTSRCTVIAEKATEALSELIHTLLQHHAYFFLESVANVRILGNGPKWTWTKHSEAFEPFTPIKGNASTLKGRKRLGYTSRTTLERPVPLKMIHPAWCTAAPSETSRAPLQGTGPQPEILSCAN